VQVGYIEELISQQRGTECASSPKPAVRRAHDHRPGTRLFPAAERHNLCLQALLQDTTGRSESFLFHAAAPREIRGFIDSYSAGR